MSTAPLLAALRLARRNARRHRGRSALIALMIALPVLGLTSVDVLARTMQLDPAERLTRLLGNTSAELTYLGHHVDQSAVDVSNMTVEAPGPSLRPGTRVFARRVAAARAVLPAGSRFLAVVHSDVEVWAHGRAVSAGATGLDLRDPATGGMARIVTGRAPGRGEAAVTSALAGRLGLHFGDSVTVGRTHLRVVGTYQSPNALAAQALLALPGGVPVPRSGHEQSLLVAGPAVPWATVRALNAAGFLVESRNAVLHPPAGVPLSNTSANRPTTVGIAVVVVGLAVLEVILLAGAAFAVGARRQRRDLALVAATGASPRQVARLVLSGGGVLGTVGAVFGLAAGIGVGWAGLGLVSRLVGRLPGHVDIRPLELTAIAALGLASGILAAWLPARAAAKDDVVDALAGRRGVIKGGRRVPSVGLAMIVLGAATAAYAAHAPVRLTLLLVGAVTAELGFVVCAPAVVGATGRLARWLPLAPRLALRDAARHRNRTGPAVAAILAALAGATAVATYAASNLEMERRAYQPMARIGQAVLSVQDRPSAVSTVTPATGRRRLASIVGHDLPGTRLVAAPFVSAWLTPSTCRSACADLNGAAVTVGGSALLEAVTGRADPAAERALARGEVVLFLPAQLVNDRVGLDTSSGSTNAVRTHRLPAFVAPVAGGAASGALVSTATARRLHIQPTGTRYLLSGSPSQVQVDRMNHDLGRSHASVAVERGYRANLNVAVLALMLGAAVVALGATGVTTGLSAAESRPDVAALGAVGAAPRTRKWLVANQAATVAALGTALGIVAGLISAGAIITANGAMPLVIPWSMLAALLVGIPALGMAATGLVTSSRIPVERRAG